MRFTGLKTPNPKSFKYKARYYDEAKEERDRRKAEMGYESKFEDRDSLRMKISSRWRKTEEEKSRPLAKFISYVVYTTIIFGSIYFIFFTDIVDNLVALFGVKK